jgi:probable H4MPT-linked C1 transfer pathway protein
MATTPTDRLALDVGGANIKLAHSSGVVRSRRFSLWKDPDRLAEVVAALADGLPPFDEVVLTTTAELCDCFATKRDGVDMVVAAVAAAFSGPRLRVWGVDGHFHEPAEIRADPLLAAAANWLALAKVAAREIPDRSGLLIDIGSTTTDLIPLAAGSVAARGRTDTGRLQSGELVYAGVRRTPVAALATSLPFRGRATGLAAELFATTLDVYLTLGDLADDAADLDTADARPATRDAARDRLARMVGADREDFTPDDALAFARAADEALRERLARSARQACEPIGGMPQVMVVSGSGEFLARRLAGRVAPPGTPVVSLGELWGPAASTAACARALLELADPARRGGPV